MAIKLKDKWGGSWKEVFITLKNSLVLLWLSEI